MKLFVLVFWAVFPAALSAFSEPLLFKGLKNIPEKTAEINFRFSAVEFDEYLYADCASKWSWVTTDFNINAAAYRSHHKTSSETKFFMEVAAGMPGGLTLFVSAPYAMNYYKSSAVTLANGNENREISEKGFAENVNFALKKGFDLKKSKSSRMPEYNDLGVLFEMSFPVGKHLAEKEVDYIPTSDGSVNLKGGIIAQKLFTKTETYIKNKKKYINQIPFLRVTGAASYIYRYPYAVVNTLTYQSS